MDKTTQNVIFNQLSKFITYFCNMDYPFEKAHSLLLHYFKEFKLNENRMQILIIELKCNQMNSEELFSQNQIKILTKEKYKKRQSKFGQNIISTVIGFSIKFIDSDLTLRNVLCLNKNVHLNCKKAVFKQIMFRTDIYDIENKRTQIWLQNLNVKKENTAAIYETYCN